MIRKISGIAFSGFLHQAYRARSKLLLCRKFPPFQYLSQCPCPQFPCSYYTSAILHIPCQMLLNDPIPGNAVPAGYRRDHTDPDRGYLLKATIMDSGKFCPVLRRNHSSAVINPARNKFHTLHADSQAKSHMCFRTYN